VVPALRRLVSRALPPLPPIDRRGRWALAAIVAGGAILRLAWAVKAQEPEELRDPVLYLLLGDQIAHGHGYSYPGAAGGVTAYYPPGYPLMLGSLIWLVGLLPGEVSAFDVAVGANVVLSVATIGLVFVLGRRLVDERVGMVAAGAFALWPNLILHTGVVLTETLFLFLFVLMLLVALPTPELARHPGRWRLVTVGALFGAAGLVRPVSFVIAPLFLLLWWPDGARRAARNLAVVGVATVALIVPWTIRNAVSMDSPILLSANFGDNFCIGNSPEASGGYALPSYCFEGLDSGERPEFEVRRQSETLDRGWRWIRENPLDAVALVPDRARYTLRDDHDGLQVANDFGAHPVVGEGATDALRAVSDGFYYLVVVAAAAGIVVSALRGAWRDRRWVLFVLTAPVQLVSPLVTFGEPRFKMPIYPVLAVAAGVGLVGLWRRGTVFPGPAETAAEPAPGDGGRPPPPRDEPELATTARTEGPSSTG
jgi:4-amino-4-deoxy-L-arabinose transferase-like glycosyltransferase